MGEVQVRGFTDVAQDLISAGTDAASNLAQKIDQMGQGVKLKIDANGFIKSNNDKFIVKGTDGKWSESTVGGTNAAPTNAAKSGDIRDIKNNPAGGDVTKLNLTEMSTSDYMVGQMEIGQLTSVFESINAANTVNNQKVSDAAKKIEQSAR